MLESLKKLKTSLLKKKDTYNRGQSLADDCNVKELILMVAALNGFTVEDYRIMLNKIINESTYENLHEIEVLIKVLRTSHYFDAVRSDIALEISNLHIKYNMLLNQNNKSKFNMK